MSVLLENLLDGPPRPPAGGGKFPGRLDPVDGGRGGVGGLKGP